MESLLVLLATLQQLVRAGQIPVPPLFTPCEFPSPLLKQTHFEQLCSTHASSKLHFICDLHQQLAHVPLHEVEQMYDKFRGVFEIRNKTNIGIVFVRQLEQASNVGAVYDETRYSCLFEHECSRLDAEVIAAFTNNVKMFMKVYAWKVFERWFGMHEGCQPPNVLSLIVMDGLVNDARKIPYVRIHSGDNRLKHAVSNIEIETTNAIVQGLPLQHILRDLLSDLGIAFKEFYDLNGEPRDHSVPQWARELFMLCGALIAFAIFLEWYLVRRNRSVKKSASGIKIVSGKSKTHLMF